MAVAFNFFLGAAGSREPFSQRPAGGAHRAAAPPSIVVAPVLDLGPVQA